MFYADSWSHYKQQKNAAIAPSIAQVSNTAKQCSQAYRCFTIKAKASNPSQKTILLALMMLANAAGFAISSYPLNSHNNVGCFKMQQMGFWVCQNRQNELAITVVGRFCKCCFCPLQQLTVLTIAILALGVNVGSKHVYHWSLHLFKLRLKQNLFLLHSKHPLGMVVVLCIFSQTPCDMHLVSTSHSICLCRSKRAEDFSLNFVELRHLTK